MKHVDTIVLVEDVRRSRAFYEGLLGLEVLHDWESMVVYRDRFAIQQVSGVLPADNSARLFAPSDLGRGNLIVYFETDDLEGSRDRLRAAGVPVVCDIVQLPWQRMFRVADPDGHVVEIGEPH